MNFGNMMKQAREMQTRMAEAEKNIEAIEVEGTSGGGSVLVVLNGKGVPQRFKIDPSAVDPNDVEVLEDLLIAAYNAAKKIADEESSKEMKKATGGMSLPPGMGMPF